MVKESLKEKLLNVKPGDFDKIMRHQITQEDIKDFYDLYCEFAFFETDYQQMILGRKDAAKDLTKRLELLKQMNQNSHNNLQFTGSDKYLEVHPEEQFEYQSMCINWTEFIEIYKTIKM